MTGRDSIGRLVQVYDSMAEELIPRYESVEFEDVHKDLIPWLPSRPATVLDVGSGSGRDSKALAEMGYDVISAEPSEKMLGWAKRNNGHGRIEWVQDSLPALEKVTELHKRFDLILVSAVMMHLSYQERRQSFKTLSQLLSMGGILYVSVSRGAKNDLREYLDVASEELNTFAVENSLNLLLQKKRADRFGRSDVEWDVSIYKKTND